MKTDNITIWVCEEFSIIADHDKRIYSVFNSLTQNYTPSMFTPLVIRQLDSIHDFKLIISCLLDTNYDRGDTYQFDKFIRKSYSDFI